MTAEPWYRSAKRWGQTNLVEIDPQRYDGAWWRAHWKSTRIQGVIVNAGGIVAYYPSRFPLHHRAKTLGGCDLYGEIVRDARTAGLKVIARMDSNRVAEDFYRAHPDWICVDASGKPYRQADKYITCINSPYYWEYLPEVMREIIGRSGPDGFADNSWAGIPRKNICHCRYCAESFRAYSGLNLPSASDWADERYRRWIRWNYQRRTDLWEFNNSVTMAAGGDHCRWMGMISGNVLNNSSRFIDLQAILARTEIVMLDHQRRNVIDGFADNTEAGKRLHEVGGWHKLIPESMPQYQLGAPAFRLASMPRAELRLWSSAGFAGGIQPWWHHIGSLHEDRRQYRSAEPVFSWHEENQDVLLDRQPLADIGVVWSQDNHDFYGQDKTEDRTMAPYRGVTQALDQAGLAYLPVHADAIAAAPGRFAVLILPNIGALSSSQAEAIKAFAEAGGSVIATSETGLYDENGNRRPDFALCDLFGVRRGEGQHGGQDLANSDIETSARHTYIRLSPESRAAVYGPADTTAPEPLGTRHPILQGLDETDTIPFGGYLPVVNVDEHVAVLATFIPDFPIYPPETSWMRQPHSDLPMITLRDHASGGKLIWLAADLDRCFARDRHPEHALIIANAARWAVGRQAAVTLEGTYGVISPSLYEQDGRYILHLNNRLITASVPGRQSELIPIGPVTVRLRLGLGETADVVQLRVAGEQVTATSKGQELVFTVPQVLDHEVAVIHRRKG